MKEAPEQINKLVYADVDEIPDDGFRAHLDDEEITDYLIVHEDETIGFVTLREGHHSSRQYSHYLRIVNLAVDEAHRNRGHGTEVVDREFDPEMTPDQADRLYARWEDAVERAKDWVREGGD